MKLYKCDRQEFLQSISDDKRDKFAKTFVAKADMQNIWEQCTGVWDDNNCLLGAVILTISKREPKISNLQLLHVFFNHRKKGLGRMLINYALSSAIKQNSKYFRISSEPESVDFYKRCGLKFWGEQKSGCLLSIFKINGNDFSEGIYDENDIFINKLLYNKRKGSLNYGDR